MRAWVEQAAIESVTFQRKLWIEKTNEALNEVEAAGVTIYRPDKTPFIEATKRMYKKLDGQSVGILATRIREVK